MEIFNTISRKVLNNSRLIKKIKAIKSIKSSWNQDNTLMCHSIKTITWMSEQRIHIELNINPMFTSTMSVIKVDLHLPSIMFQLIINNLFNLSLSSISRSEEHLYRIKSITIFQLVLLSPNHRPKTLILTTKKHMKYCWRSMKNCMISSKNKKKVMRNYQSSLKN